MTEEDYDIPFQIVAVAGNARSLALMAVESAREGDMEQAESYLKEANESCLEAHKVQTQLLTNEAQGNAMEVNLIMVHAQDHLTMATLALENAKEFINLYKLIGSRDS